MTSYRVTVNQLHSEGISESVQKLAGYGLRNIGFQILLTSSLILVASLTGYTPEVVGFLGLFLPLRLSLPGSHASSRGKCLLQSLVTVGLIVGLSGLIDTTDYASPIAVAMILGLISLSLSYAGYRKLGRIAGKHRPIGLMLASLSTIGFYLALPQALFSAAVTLSWVMIEFFHTMSVKKSEKTNDTYKQTK